MRSLSFIYDSTDVYPPPKRGRDIKDAEFGDPTAPFLVGSYADQLSAICSPRRRWLTLSPTNGTGRKIPPQFKPYVAVGFTVHPWRLRVAAHTTALANQGERAQRIPQHCQQER